MNTVTANVSLERKVPSSSFIPNCVPFLNGSEQRYVQEALSQGFLAIGPHIGRFEKAIAEYTGASHAIAVASGSAALHLALVVAGVGKSDLVLVPTMTFAATANAVRYCGADPIFLDVDPHCWGIDPNAVRDFLSHHCSSEGGRVIERRSGRRIAALVPVDLYGHPADHDALAKIAAEYDLPIVEDAAEALGAEYKGRRLGATARLACLSFNGNKIITGGNGGMVLTSDSELARRVRYLAAQAKDDGIEFVHGEVGYNYRMPNVNAAVALAQAERLDELVAAKRRIAADYDAELSDLDGVSMWREQQWARSSNWMAIVTFDERLRSDAVATLRRELPARGIEARPTWLPLHGQKAFAGSICGSIQIADRLYRTSLCLPCSAGLTEMERVRVSSAIRSILTSHA